MLFFTLPLVFKKLKIVFLVVELLFKIFSYYVDIINAFKIILYFKI